MMRNAVVILLAILAISLVAPAASMGAFYGTGIPIDTVYPEFTHEGSGFALSSFSAVPGMEISFDYNFISVEANYDPITQTFGSTAWNDWLGVVLIDAENGEIAYFEKVTDINTAPWQLASSSGLVAPHGDFNGLLTAQTGIQHFQFTVPGFFDGALVYLGIGVFDLNDWGYETAALVDNINLPGGDFESDPFIGPKAGPNGLFILGSPGLISGIDEPGTGNFAYISTYHGSLANPAVPAPAALWLLASGLLGFAGVRRKA